ncbi:radical SAM protein [Planctomycetota bacterium]
MQITEIFLSIQGESLQAGLPAVFVRCTGCNLNCSYCDTQYARQGGRSMTVGEIVDAVREMGVPRVCLTGGEPLLQDETLALCAALVQPGWDVQVETNGSQDIGGLPAEARAIMDIKTPGSGVSDEGRPADLKALRPGDEIKCVITDEADYAWARDYLDRERPDGIPVIFTAARGRLEPRLLAEWLCRDRAAMIRFQLQLHTVLWPGEAGR